MGEAPIAVSTASAHYPVRIVCGGVRAIGGLVSGAAPSGRLIVVSDSHVAPLYAEPLVDCLRGEGRETRILVFPPGEQSKSGETIAALWDGAFAEPLDRDDKIVAVGGGVVGDLAGFLASTLMRGIGIIQVPTTLLAMADAAIGGKTGINLSVGKNLVGTFHQPLAVVAWVGSLATLPPRELRSGMAEVVKSAFIAGDEELGQIEADAELLAAGDPEALQRAIRIAAALKASVVTEDERESGLRRVLNFGHTFGHCIEHAVGYGDRTHGEAVAIGMAMALRFSRRLGLVDDHEVTRLTGLLATLKLPVVPPSFTLCEWTSPIERDKKRHGADVELIVTSGPGAVFARRTPLDELKNWLQDDVVESETSTRDPG